MEFKPDNFDKEFSLNKNKNKKKTKNSPRGKMPSWLMILAGAAVIGGVVAARQPASRTVNNAFTSVAVSTAQSVSVEPALFTGINDEKLDSSELEARFLSQGSQINYQYIQPVLPDGTIQGIDMELDPLPVDENGGIDAQKADDNAVVYWIDGDPYAVRIQSEKQEQPVSQDEKASEYYWLNDEAVYENTKAMGKTTKAVIDNMVAEGKMEPTIFVASTYETKDKNGNRLTEGDMSGYAQEFRNIIVPLVESTYSTYCAGDVSEENLIATRDHRGFAGFSMGSRCTVDGILMHDLDLVAWYGAYSGPDASLGGGGGVSAEDVKAVMESFGPEMDIKYIYNGDGTADFALEGHQTFAYGLLEVMPESFQDGRNWCWVCFKGGSHAYNCWIVDLYNSMLVFFK